MEIIAIVLVALVAIEHLIILVVEMFFWTKARTRKIFGLSSELAEQTKAMAANQGLYNGFLAAGLFWGLVHSNLAFGFQIQCFFLLCVILASIYGAFSVKRSIFLVQGVPAILALLALIIT